MPETIKIFLAALIWLGYAPAAPAEPTDVPAFLQACAAGNTVAITQSPVLRTGRVNELDDVAIRDETFKRTSGLHLAAYYGNDEVVRLLIQKGADIELVDGALRTPLFAAIGGTATNGGAVRALVDAGAKTEATGFQKLTPLLFAATLGRTDLVGILLKGGADPRARDQMGAGIYSVAIYGGNGAPFLNYLKELVPLPPVGDEGFSMSPGQVCVLSGNIAALRWLESNGYDPRPDLANSGVLFSAVSKCDAAMVSELSRLKPALLMKDARERTVMEIARSLEDCPQKEAIVCLLSAW